GSAAGLWINVFKVICINAVESVEITLHVHQKNLDIHKLIPAAAIFFENGFYIGKYRMHLSFKIKSLKVSVVIQFQPGHARIIGIAAGNAGANSAKKKNVANFAC